MFDSCVNAGTFLNTVIASINNYLSTPMLLLVFATGIIMTLAFNFIQFRYFLTSFGYIFNPEPAHNGKANTISPLQAFLGTLSTSMGNGSLAGMGVAMYEGGPGGVFWAFMLGFFTTAIRFAETYASTAFTVTTEYGVRGGPMVYLSKVPGGTVLPYIYAFFALLLSVVMGNAMQCNSMAAGIHSMTEWNLYIIATILLALVLYIVLGGADRIIKFSDALAPLKVILFLIAIVAVFGYFFAEIPSALVLVFNAAFSREAFVGGLVGHTMANALSASVNRTLGATDTGLGDAGILFGAAGDVNPSKTGIMSMASTYISTQIVCFLMLLGFVIAGVWNSGATGMNLVIAMFASVFGASLGGWIATILAIMFGMGVLVAYAFIGRECWLFLTHGRWSNAYYVLYCAMAFLGSLAEVTSVYCIIGFIVTGLIFCNLYGLLYLLPQMKRGWRAHLEK